MVITQLYTSLVPDKVKGTEGEAMKEHLTDEEREERERLVKGGKALRAIRESKRRSQEDIAGRTRIQLARLSHIERGLVAKPPSLRDVAELAFEYGLSPRSMFEIYGLPIASLAASAPEEDPEEIVALRAVLRELPDEASKAEILGMIGWVVDMANAKIASLAREEDTSISTRRARRARA